MRIQKQKVEVCRLALRFLGVTLTLTSGLFLQVGQAVARPLDPISSEQTLQLLNEMTPIPFNGKSLERDDGWSGSCRRSIVTISVTDTVTGVARLQNLTVIRPAKTLTPVPVMVVVPTMEGITPIETSIASSFCDAQIATIIADVDDNTVPTVMPSWGLEDVRDRYSVLALRTTIDFAHNSPYFDHNRVGFMGLSLGAIMGSFIASLESDRLAATVLVLAGGNLPYILSISDNERITEMRDQRMKATGIKLVTDYEEKLHQTLRYDPLRFSFAAKPGNMLMVMSSNDNKVPTVAQNTLHEAFGRPESSLYSLSHVETVIALTYFYFHTVTDFLNTKMDLKPLPEAKPKPSAGLKTGTRDLKATPYLPPIHIPQGQPVY